MNEILRPDLCVLGAGSGGLSAASAAAALGASVVLVEKGRLGGECLYTGCVPSKALIAAAHVAKTIRRAGAFGLVAPAPALDFEALQAHVSGVIAAVGASDSEARYRAMNVRVVKATGRFVGVDALEAGDFTIKARRFIVATGSRPVIPKIVGLELVRYLTTDDLFDLRAAPARLAILGAGAVGVEIGQAWRRLGADVTLIDSGAALASVDPDLAGFALRRLKAEGVKVFEQARILRVEPAGAGARVVLAGETRETMVEASHVLVAAGRAPVVEGLGLEAARVAFSAAGVKTRPDMRTTNARIYAVGDVAGERPSTHGANHQAGLALRAALFRWSGRYDATLVPQTIFTDPEIASVGLSEAQARAKRYKVRVFHAAFGESDRAVADRDAQGLVKIVADHKRRLLGAGVAGPRAGELISFWQLALAKSVSLTDIAQLPAPYPTYGEINRRVALEALAGRLKSPAVGRLMRFLRRVG